MRSITSIPTCSSLSQEKTLFQLYKYYNLNLLNELLGVISPHGFDMGNVGLNVSVYYTTTVFHVSV